MQNAKEFQDQLASNLKNHFSKVEKEWSISKDATDDFSRSIKRYAPRLDIAVGPFSIETGNIRNPIERTFHKEVPSKLRQILEQLGRNPNPRCALAIEIVFSGSSKHILGDITNASMMGLYGIVIADQGIEPKIRRIFEYVKTIRKLDKAPSELFTNVIILPSKKILELL